MRDEDDNEARKRPGSRSKGGLMKAVLTGRSRKELEPTSNPKVLGGHEPGYMRIRLNSAGEVEAYKAPDPEGKRQNRYENQSLSDSIEELNDDVTILAKFISATYSLDMEDAAAIAHAEKSRIDQIVSDFRAGKSLTLETEFKPAADSGATAALTLPDAPPKYPYAPRMAGGIVKYLEDNWAPYIEAGLLTRPDLNRIDPDAYQALRNWLRQNELPDHLYLPTVSEAIDREIEDLGGARRIKRLAAALAARERKLP